MKKHKLFLWARTLLLADQRVQYQQCPEVVWILGTKPTIFLHKRAYKVFRPKFRYLGPSLTSDVVSNHHLYTVDDPGNDFGCFRARPKTLAIENDSQDVELDLKETLFIMIPAQCSMCA